MMRELLAKVVPMRFARAPTADRSAEAETSRGGAPPDESRRSLLTRGLSLAAGAVGVTAAGAWLQSGGRQTPAAVPVAVHDPVPVPVPAARTVPDLTATELSLFIRDIRFSSPGQRPGELPTGKTASAPHGTLVDSAGVTVGSFAGGLLPGSAGQIAFQRFVFPNGTLIGMGSGSFDGEDYAVVGGTGIYAGAVGTYQTKIQLGARGRDAEFTFNVAGAR
jgi:hypothetical protein